MVSIMGTPPRLPGWDMVLGVWCNSGKTQRDIAFDSIVITNSTTNPGHVSLSLRVRTYENVTIVPDNDTALVTHITHAKYGNVVVYVIDADSNSLHLLFHEGDEKNLLEVSFLYEEDTTFGKDKFVLRFERVIPEGKLDRSIGYLNTIEGIFRDERVNLNASPDKWVQPFARPVIITAGYIHYFPLFVLGSLLPACTKMDAVDVDKDGNYIVTDRDSFTWTIPGTLVDIQNNGILLTDSSTTYKLKKVSDLRASGLSTFGSGSKLLGNYKSRDGEELTIHEDEINTNQFTSKFSLNGSQKCAIGYAEANTVVMIYYPLVIVHFGAFTYDEDFNPMKERVQGYLADGEEWPPLPSGGGGGGGGGGSSGLLLGLVGLMALAFMAK